MEATESPPAAALTETQIDALAPDPAAAAAGRKLASPATWSGLGRDDAAFWGECQGSAVYRVVFERASLAYKCTCPSFKRPCKHALALGYLLARGKVAEA